VPYTQNERIFTVHSILGDDALLLRSMRGIEAVGQPFHFELELASEQSDIDFRSILGSGLTLEMQLEGAPPRYVNGIVSRFMQGGANDRFVFYRAEIVPWFWLLSRGSNCRIFQELSVLEILKKVFSGRGFSDFEDKTSGAYVPMTYCVQYRESDYDFARRLMEENGIGFYFTHDDKRHVMVLFDSPDGNLACPQVAATYVAAEAQLRMGNVWSWSSERLLGPGACALCDYDFEKPNMSLTVSTATADPIGGNETFEIYDYPGVYTSVDRGETLAKLRMEAEEAASIAATATSDCAHFCAGGHFQLLGHYRGDYNVPQLLTRVVHTGRQSLRGEEPVPSTYENEFTCIPYSVPWRPLRTTRKPTIQGVQTAVVVGPPGEEIYVDSHARVKVQFHWDREGKRDEHSSCWIRVSQLWAGKNWGGVSIPRIGQEVIVEFLEGDPDRPIITGRVYNADQQPPFPLPEGANNMGIKSRSTPGGGGYNEISMDDTKGKEGITIHAQYDMSTTVEHDQSTKVIGDRSVAVDGNETITIRGATGRKSDIDVGNEVLTVKTGDRTADINTGNDTTTVKTGSSTTNVNTGNHALNVLTGNQTVTVNTGVAALTVASADRTVNVPAGTYVLTANEVSVTGISKITLMSPTEIVIGVGASSITLKPDGVYISGPKISSTALGVHEITGAIVKIN